jgi:nardilysin
MTVELIKSTNDRKQYKLLTLTNGLEVIMVSTSECSLQSTKAAASVAVQAGSFSDPMEAQGLAHYLEHMVFMGSTTYPVENYYDAYVQSHGGQCNALTEGEYTNYLFDISTEFFAIALDIFANALLYPLLAPSALTRELDSIESEFSMNLSNDGARLQQLLGVSCSPGHVLQKFSWGNEYSLKTMPQKANVDVIQLMREFHSTHYFPQNMKLVVVVPKPMDEIEAIIMASTFGKPLAVPAPTVQPQQALLSSMSFPLLPESFQKVYRIIPTRKNHTLLLSWQVPPIQKCYRTKSASYLGHLLGHEGPNSLLSELKLLGFSTGVSAGVTEGNVDNNSMFAIFNVTSVLTPKGLANWFTVVSVIFAYLRMLQREGPQEWIYQEIQDMNEIEFAYLEEQEEEEFAEALATEMLPYLARDRVDLLTSPHLFSQFDASEIASLTSLLTDPRTARIEILSSSFYIPGKTIEVEGEDPETEWSDCEGDDSSGDGEDDDGEEEDEDDEVKS